MSAKRSLPGFVKLLLCMGAIWLLLWVVTPAWVSLSPLHQEFADAQERYDVPIGASYYNDLPFIVDASTELRDARRFPPRGPAAGR